MTMLTLKNKSPKKNKISTSKEVIIDQMNEPRPLPMGRAAFDEWSDRIISGSLIPGDLAYDPNAPYDVSNEKTFIDSQKFILANALLHLGPTESHKPDAFFIHSLRKFAINQVADTIRKEIHESAKARLKEQEAAKQQDETIQ